MNALAGLRVVEFADGLAGSVAGTLMADYGAEVVKISTAAVPRTGAMAFRYRNKAALVIDPDRDAHLLAGYFAGADVVILADRWASHGWQGRAGEALAANGHAIVARMPTTWLGDPKWATDVESHGLLCAYAAISSRQMSTDGSPVEMVGPYVLYIHGIWSAASILSAVFAQGEGEAGQQIVVSGVHASMVTSSASVAVDPNGPETSTKVGAFGKHPTYRPFRAKCGGWIASGALGQRFVGLMLVELGLGWMIDEPRVGGNPDAVTFPQNFEWSTALIEKAFLQHDVAHWAARFREKGIPVEPVRHRDGLMDGVQVTANGIDWRLDAEGWGQVVTPAPPAILTRTPPSFRHVAQGAESSWPAKSAPTVEAQVRPGPLAGVKVLNLGTFVATPMAGFLLAELGADVVKVEDLEGDPFRATGFSFNRGMRSLSVSLRTGEGRDLFRRLSRSADVAINGMRPGTMARLGLDHDRLAADNPGLISIALSAYGTQGPKAMLPGVDMVIQAMTGIMAAQGDGTTPYVSSAAYVDVTSACVSVWATALALVERKRSGRGQAVEAALLRTAVFMQAEQVTGVNGTAGLVQGDTDYKGRADHDRLHRTADGWVRIAASDAACVTAALGTAGIAQGMARITTAEAVTRLTAAGIPAIPARKVKELLRDPDFVQSGQVVFVPGEVHILPMVGRLAHFAGGQVGRTLLPPGIGEHSVTLLQEYGLRPDEIDTLIRADTVRAGVPMPLRFGLTYR
ncbi:CoA transferase [Chachezhania sediminis]|uniref:CoA transferase n=1 Tax=Chachezhania sediminis TaxID=2599291 RepID=UPI00131DE8BC|nr:CoA transferase [Chachezhania sediminis]